MISGRMFWERNFVSMPLAMLTTGLLLQLIMLGTTRVVAQGEIPPPLPSPPPPLPPPETKSTIPPSTSTRSTTIKTTVTTGATTTDFMDCDMCKSGPSGGAIAGIVIGVLIVYIVSLIVVAILASVLTKKGTIDLSRYKLFRIVSNSDDDNKAEKNSNTELAEQNDYTDEMHSSHPGGLYASLDGSTRVETPAEPSPYEALQMHGGHKNRNAKKPRIKKKPTSTVTKETDDEKPMATVAPQEVTDDEIYQNY